MNNELIIKLAEKLGVTVEHLWGVLVAQAPISAATDLFFCVVSALVGVILIMVVINWFKSQPDDYDKDIKLFFSVIFLLIVGLIIFSVWDSHVSMIVAGFFNPEFWALKQVLK